MKAELYLKAAIFAIALLLPALESAGAAKRPENGTRFEAHGATIYYEVLGSGSSLPLLVVNGGPGFDHSYMHVSNAWETLSQHRRVIFYDQRGTGRSITSTKGQTYTLADQISDLEDLRAQLGADKIDLLGHSWGGYLVMAYAARHPEHIAHLMIVDSAAPHFDDTIFLFKDVFPEGTEREDNLAFAEDMGDRTAVEANLHEYITMLFYSTQKRDEFVASFSPDAYHKDVNEAVVNDIKRFDLNPELKKFRFPTLVITGRYDINVAPLVAYKIHQTIADSRFQVFEHSGHLPFFEEPDAFVQSVEEFLGRTGK